MPSNSWTRTNQPALKPFSLHNSGVMKKVGAVHSFIPPLQYINEFLSAYQDYVTQSDFLDLVRPKQQICFYA